MNRILDCIINKNTSFVPVWFMRQAGRYLPEFRKIREKNTNFIKLCLNPNLVKEITLQPKKRFDLDATIIFSDILMIPYALNQIVEFKKGSGPHLGNLELDKIINTNSNNFINKLLPVYEGIKKVKNETKDEALIGFVGAPWTLLVYMINKKSPKKDFNFNYIIKDKVLVNELLKKLEETICLHINHQVKAGANIIQIFDSWAGLIPQKELFNYCFAPTSKIVKYVKSLKIPVICFPKGIGKNFKDFCSIVQPNCVSIDPEVDPKLIKKETNGIAIQGGIDPKILLEGNDQIKKTVQKYLQIFSGYPYVFNLGHGVLPETKPETIEYIIQIVRDQT